MKDRIGLTKEIKKTLEGNRIRMMADIKVYAIMHDATIEEVADIVKELVLKELQKR